METNHNINKSNKNENITYVDTPKYIYPSMPFKCPLVCLML